MMANHRTLPAWCKKPDRVPPRQPLGPNPAPYGETDGKVQPLTTTTKINTGFPKHYLLVVVLAEKSRSVLGSLSPAAQAPTPAAT
jgi:hypothetical protein